MMIIDPQFHAYEANMPKRPRHSAPNWPDHVPSTTSEAVEPFLETGRLSETERAMLMGGACTKAYGWSPRKGLAIRRADKRSVIRRLAAPSPFRRVTLR